MVSKKSKKYMTEAELQAREANKESDAKKLKFKKLEEWSFPSFPLAEVKRDELKEAVGDNQNRRVRIRRRAEGFGVVLYEKPSKKAEKAADNAQPQ